jgi:hypothetical protein
MVALAVLHAFPVGAAEGQAAAKSRPEAAAPELRVDASSTPARAAMHHPVMLACGRE